MSPAAATTFASPGGGGGGGSVSSASRASTQPGSSGKSISPSASLSRPSEHCGSIGSAEVSTTSWGRLLCASRLLKVASPVALHPGACRSMKLTGPAPVTAEVTSKLWYPLEDQATVASTGPAGPGWLIHVIVVSPQSSAAARISSAPAPHLLSELAKTRSVALLTVSPR